MEKITYNDFELEFLELYGFKVINDGEIKNTNTGITLGFYKYIEEVNRDSSSCKKFVYTSGDVTIEFIREKDTKGKPTTRINIRYGGYNHWAEERLFDGIINERYIGVDSETGGSLIMINHDEASDYFSSTQIIKHANKEKQSNYDIRCSLSTIYPNATYIREREAGGLEDVTMSDTPLEINMENFEKALVLGINKMFKDNNEVKGFYLRAISFITKAFVSSLCVPYRYVNFYEKKLEYRRKKMEKYYVGQYLERKLDEIDDMERFLRYYYPEINKGKDK